MKRVILLLMIFMLGAYPVFAGDIQVPPNQAKLEINGAVCAYCAYGMQKSLSKFEYIDKSQANKGVESDNENQIITLYLKEGQSIDLNDACTAIKKGGYEPRTFHLRVAGSPVKDGDKMFLTDSNNERLFELVGDQASQLKNQNYDLQLLIDEVSIGQLKSGQPPMAQVQSIIEGE